MQALESLKPFAVGYSDHTVGIEVPVAAVAMGAAVIEKHFTLDKTLPGPDHKASLEPSELAAMVRSIRNIECALGSAEKHVSPSERANIEIARKSIVAARDIKAGDGIPPMRWDEIIGVAAPRDFVADSLIEL